MITRGLGNGSLIARGMTITFLEIIIPEGGGRKKRHLFYITKEVKKYKIKRSEAAKEFIDELEEKILETGVVKNTHEPYDPKSNKRYKVSKKQAARIAYSIAKKEGLKVGKYRGPNKQKG